MSSGGIDGGGELQLVGAAVDQAAQNLTGKQLRWYDGPFLLGTGANLTAEPLPPGINHILLVARDPQGRTASASLTVDVSKLRLPFLKLKIPAHVSPRTKSLALVGSTAVSVTLTIGHHTFRLGSKTRRLRLPIRRGRSALLLELTVRADGMTTPFAARVSR